MRQVQKMLLQTLAFRGTEQTHPLSASWGKARPRLQHPGPTRTGAGAVQATKHLAGCHARTCQLGGMQAYRQKSWTASLSNKMPTPRRAGSHGQGTEPNYGTVFKTQDLAFRGQCGARSPTINENSQPKQASKTFCP